jgi:hypothetical protein
MKVKPLHVGARLGSVSLAAATHGGSRAAARSLAANHGGRMPGVNVLSDFLSKPKTHAYVVLQQEIPTGGVNPWSSPRRTELGNDVNIVTSQHFLLRFENASAP